MRARLMSRLYKGVCKLGLKARNHVTEIQVTYPGGRMTKSIPEYEAEQIQPPWQGLLWCEDMPATSVTFTEKEIRPQDVPGRKPPKR
jgi:hypothetical protein